MRSRSEAGSRSARSFSRAPGAAVTVKGQIIVAVSSKWRMRLQAEFEK
jgi:hypothetical protein